jgi:putative nucleotidyltransferase with HDIG domain
VAALALAREVGISDEATLKAIEAAALLHDTGKIAVPEHILNKPGKLTAAEFEKMKLHAPIGAEILSAIEFPYPVVPIVRHHHENWDGTGYPDGSSGADIPIGARILSVVDCFDALTSDRPYRRRMSDADSVAILLARRGTMYDPAIVDTFVRARHQIMPPPEAAAHPFTRTLGGARELTADPIDVAAAPAGDAAATSEVLAVAASRAPSRGKRPSLTSARSPG